MKSFYILILTLVFSLVFIDVANAESLAKKGPIKERKLYVGKDSTEAIMTFDATLNPGRKNLSPTAAREKIEAQVQHLFGPMSVTYYRGKLKALAVPRGNHKITKVKIDAKTGLISYSYSGTIVLQNGPRTNYEIFLPLNPDTIYKASMVGDKNPCTDDHYQDEGDFWYFWNPDNQGCKIKPVDSSGEGDYLVIPAKVTRIANSKISYPEYDRLIGQNAEINVSLLLGMDDPDHKRDPNESNDVNALTFRGIKKTLLAGGYTSRPWSPEEISEIAKKASAGGVYVEEFTKEITNPKTQKTVPMVVRIFFGPSGIDEDAHSFHYFFKDALENQSLLMYDGHSGLGGHLDLPSIEEEVGKIKPNKKQYQIYFFNSCTSYSYYNTMFFERKKTSTDSKGTKNLDIFTNGLATYFSIMNSTNLVMIQAIEAYFSGKGRLSYQAIARQIDSDNLFGVNGDEDNP